MIVLRDGEIVGTLSQKEMKAENAVQRIRYLMVGREIGEKYYREDFVASCKEEVALQLEHIYTETIKDFNLTLHKGEIIGLGGLSGCGMHEIGRIAYGIEKPDAGKVLRNGKEIKTPLSAIESGIGYISKNRDLEALILGAAIRDNIALPSLPRLAKHLFIRPNAEKNLLTMKLKHSILNARMASSRLEHFLAGTSRRYRLQNGLPMIPRLLLWIALPVVSILE